MDNKLSNLKKRLFTKDKTLSEEDIARLHHILMINYGWIPVDEFKAMPIPTLWNLLTEIEIDYKNEQKSMGKMKSRK